MEMLPAHGTGTVTIFPGSLYPFKQAISPAVMADRLQQKATINGFDVSIVR